MGENCQVRCTSVRLCSLPAVLTISGHNWPVQARVKSQSSPSESLSRIGSSCVNGHEREVDELSAVRTFQTQLSSLLDKLFPIFLFQNSCGETVSCPPDKKV